MQFYTMPTPEEIYLALEARRTELGLSQAEIGQRAFGKADNAAFQALRRGSSPSADKLASLCRAVGWELYFGPPREVAAVEQVTLDGADYAHIPLHDAMLAAGAGAFNGTETVVDSLAFRREWLQRIGVSASTARLARVQGDSMQPSLWHGDMILIDTRTNEPPVRDRDQRDQRRSPIYALIDNGEARVKRIERPSPDQMLLISDNTDYPPELRQGTDLKAITIIGKVAWWGHTNRD
ncbi:S24 family peptidase [Gemmobacter nanjingensis]|nr:S24 family peptidase [Gemmobacter nanjingensis]